MPAIARIGDDDITHCSPMVRAEGSPNVYCNGIPISRVGDLNTVHLFPVGKHCPPHAEPISAGSSTVFVNGIPCGRIGDPTCTAVASGSHNVFAG